MIGLEVEGKPLLRAYSIASANYEENLEFLSIKVQNGPLTSRLQHLKEGDTILVSRKPVGTLVVDDLQARQAPVPVRHRHRPGALHEHHQDPDVYERFDKVILVHGVRWVSELAYADFIGNELPNNEFFGEIVRDKLVYYPTVTREPFRNQGRITELLENGKLCQDIGIPQINPETDRAMICGSPHMLADISAMLDARGFTVSPGVGQPGDYVVERAFVDK